MYIAIDGGGTKTEYLLLNERFEAVDRALGSATNHDRLPDGFEGVARAFKEDLAPLLARSGIGPEDVKGVAAGLSGADSRAQVLKLEQILRAMGFADVKVCNDGFLPVMAECAGAAGIAYNCGTGVCCTAMDVRGKMTKIGGLDEWSGDAGGGVWLLQQIFTGVYDDAVLSLRKTQLTQAYARILGIDYAQLGGELDETLPVMRSDPQIQRQLIAAAFDAYEAGDETARRICGHMISRAADYIGAAYAQSDFGSEPLQIVLSGSIMLKAATVRFLEEMKSAAELRIGRRAQWLTPRCTPVYGAAAWLKKLHKSSS